MYWKYPQLMHLIDYRTIEGVNLVFMYTNTTKLLIGYVIESTTGLLTDKTLCIHNFSEKYLNNIEIKNLLQKYKNRTCIINCYSESWGKKKVIVDNKILTEWVNDFLEDEEPKQSIIIENNLDLRMKINLKIR